MRRLSLLGGSPLAWHTPPSPSSRTAGGSTRALRPPSYRRPARARRCSDGTVARSRRRRRSGAGTVPGMDLAYPPEAEEFRAEIAGWLRDNLPEGWGEPGFSMTPDERKAFNERVDGEALRRRVDLRQLAHRVRRQGADPARSRSC